MRWTKKDIIQYYRENELAYRLYGKNMHYGFWDRTTWTIPQATRKFNQVLVRTAGINKNDHVLDAGCGVGGSSIYLAQTCGCRVTGITICPFQVKRAYRNAEKAGVAHLTRFIEMDYTSTAFRDGLFDVVWGLESICYAESKERFIRESHRVLKDNGRLVVADGFASKDSYTGAEKRIFEKFKDGWVVNTLDTPGDFTRYAVEAGFRNVQYRNVTRNVRPTSIIMYFVSMPFMPLHWLNKIVPLGPYPTDALYHQYHGLKKGLWEYGIFYGEKNGARTQKP